MASFESGTRRWQNQQFSVVTSRKFDRGYTRDLGLAEQATGAFSFNSGTGQVTLAGAFGAVQVNDAIVFEGTASNNGEFTAVAVSANVLTLKQTPVTEVAPATAYFRVA